jgi:yeast amino acid transporter
MISDSLKKRMSKIVPKESNDSNDSNEFKGEAQELNPEFNLANGHQQLERGLKSRHIQFLALGMTLILMYSY